MSDAHALSITDFPRGRWRIFAMLERWALLPPPDYADPTPEAREFVMAVKESSLPSLREATYQVMAAAAALADTASALSDASPPRHSTEPGPILVGHTIDAIESLVLTREVDDEQARAASLEQLYGLYSPAEWRVIGHVARVSQGNATVLLHEILQRIFAVQLQRDSSNPPLN